MFVRTVTEKLMTYGLGRGMEYTDMPIVRGDRARRGAAELPVLRRSCSASCKSAPFQMKTSPASTKARLASAGLEPVSP